MGPPDVRSLVFMFFFMTDGAEVIRWKNRFVLWMRHVWSDGTWNPVPVQENHQLSRNARPSSLPTDEVDSIMTIATAATVIARIA